MYFLNLFIFYVHTATSEELHLRCQPLRALLSRFLKSPCQRKGSLQERPFHLSRSFFHLAVSRKRRKWCLRGLTKPGIKDFVMYSRWMVETRRTSSKIFCEHYPCHYNYYNHNFFEVVRTFSFVYGENNGGRVTKLDSEIVLAIVFRAWWRWGRAGYIRSVNMSLNCCRKFYSICSVVGTEASRWETGIGNAQPWRVDENRDDNCV